MVLLFARYLIGDIATKKRLIMPKWFAIFKAGKHTDSSGNTKEWTEADLDKIVASYDPAKHEAPIVIGHPKTNAPAYGWIESLKRVGDTLYAKAKQLVPEFVEMVNKGLFKKRSISLYPDGTLRHVGFLGATPPAVKGLPDVEFKDGEKILNYETDYWADIDEVDKKEEHKKNFQELIKELVDQLQDTIAKKKDGKKDFKEESQAKVVQLKDTNEKSKDDKKDFQEVSQELVDQLQETIAKLTLELSQLKDENQKLRETINKIRYELAVSEFNEYLNKKIEEGKVLPKQVDGLKKIFEGCFSQDFAEKDEKKIKELKEFIESMPVQVQIGSEFKEPENVKEFKILSTTEVAKIISEQMKTYQGE